MSEKKRTITLEQALACLPEGDYIHTYTGAHMMVGATTTKESILKKLQAAKVICISGSNAQDLGHCIAIEDDESWLFIETTRAGFLALLEVVPPVKTIPKPATGIVTTNSRKQFEAWFLRTFNQNVNEAEHSPMIANIWAGWEARDNEPDSITLTGKQLLEALEFAAPDCITGSPEHSEFADQLDTEMVIFERAEITSEGVTYPAGVYAYYSDMPEEGTVGPLGVAS